MNISTFENEINAIKDNYDQIYVIVSPPRCSSTAFARVFWELPTVKYYAHEPFEGTYFMEPEPGFRARQPEESTRFAGCKAELSL